MIRLPWGLLDNIAQRYLAGRRFTVVGCVSFEERCVRVPVVMASSQERAKTIMVRVNPTEGAYPDNSLELARRMDVHESLLAAESDYTQLEAPLLATEDELIDLADNLLAELDCETMLLDISCFPKRFFCFLLKQLLRASEVSTLVVSYTQARPGGYAAGRLSLDPIASDHLPGFAPMIADADTLVIAMGFEPLSLASVVELYGKQQRPKLLFSFPANGRSFRRQWDTARQIFNGDVRAFAPGSTAVIAAWDAEQVFEQLERWNTDSAGLILGPFGAKPHTLGMALFAIQESATLYYTQPKAYSPDYSVGYAETWAYVIKRDGSPCVRPKD